MTAPDERASLVRMIDEAVADGAGLMKACAEAGIDRRTWRRWQGPDGEPVRSDGRPAALRAAPSNRLTEAERAAVLEACASARFADAAPSQIVPALADEGVYVASESSFYRLLHEADRQHERGRAKRRTSRAVTSHRATGPNRLWSWDVTYLNTATRGRFFYLYMIVDVWSRKIVGWEVHESETGELAAALVQRAVLAEDRGADAALVLHADNGAPQRSSTLRVTLERLGITSSFSRPRVSDDNPYSEALFRTTKYRPGFPTEGFADLAAARSWVHGFVAWYNTEHRHSAIRFVTPAERHEGRDGEVLAARKALYEAKRRANPSRWSGKTRDWTSIGEVWLNPERPSPEPDPDTELRNAA